MDTGVCATLRLERLENQRLRLIVVGAEGRTSQVERTDSLAQPTAWLNWSEATIKNGKWESDPFNAVGGLYFRAMVR